MGCVLVESEVAGLDHYLSPAAEGVYPRPWRQLGLALEAPADVCPVNEEAVVWIAEVAVGFLKFVGGDRVDKSLCGPGGERHPGA